MKLLLYTLFIWCVCAFAQEDTVLLEIPQGLLRGKRIETEPGVFVDFFGRVPYVQPPVGNLRFEAPVQPPPSWEGELDATDHGNVCPQLGSLFYNRTLPTLPLPPFIPVPELPSIDMQEDCLFMEVYAPERSDPEDQLPVMLFIQGGAYLIGFNAAYDASQLAGRKGVIVAVFQYRLGALGYLSTMDSVAPGNYGMLDQLAALNWIKQNVEYFGGNPREVTIFGESAGAASVGMHTLSPLSDGLFKRAIAESGSPINYWAFKAGPYDILDSTYKLADSIGCPREPHQELVDCLRTKDALEISSHVEPLNGDTIAFAPVQDGPGGFMPEAPLDLMKAGAFNVNEFLCGYNKDETAPLYLFYPGFGDGITRDTFTTIIQDIVTGRVFPEDNYDAHQATFDAIEFQYLPWQDPDDPIKLRDNAMDLKDDRFFDAGIHWQAKLAAASNVDTYVYRYDYRQSNSIWPEWVGVAHADELAMVFGIPFKPDRYDSYTDDDRIVSAAFMDMWYNFATTGNPNSPQAAQGTESEWERYTRENQRTFHIHTTSSMKDGTVDFQGHGFWNDYDHKVIRNAQNLVNICNERKRP
ncbi:acetylcholinesterase-like [Ptychodera flava]|uniref:acetylcholinesterase-like n=1 Tax=Ptychodera flava TaxID=63121 RepID=UPI00396A662D